MPVKWTADKDQMLLLKLLETVRHLHPHERTPADDAAARHEARHCQDCGSLARHHGFVLYCIYRV